MFKREGRIPNVVARPSDMITTENHLGHVGISNEFQSSNKCEADRDEEPTYND